MPDHIARAALESMITQHATNVIHEEGQPYYLGQPVDKKQFMAYVVERANAADSGKPAWCGRCGTPIPCIHLNCSTILDPAHAERIRARYAFGKLHNPDHDNATYTDPPAADATA